MSDIAERLTASLQYDAINGDAHERGIVKKQIREAIQVLQQKDAELAALRAEVEKPKAELAAEKETYRCFHCGFVAATRAEAEVHFGDESGLPPLCVEWETMDDSERVHAYQQMEIELDETREREMKAGTELGAARDRIKLLEEHAERAERKLAEAEGRLQPIVECYEKHKRDHLHDWEFEDWPELMKKHFLEFWQAIRQATDKEPKCTN